MLILDRLGDLVRLEGQMLGRSSWHPIDQARIDNFARATGDDQWIHTDPARTLAELGEPTIAHGFLTLSMIPVVMYEIVMVKSVTRMINYGANRIRFVAPVPAGTRIRGHAKLARATHKANQLSAVFEVTIEIEGSDKPAVIAEIITMFYE
jgi:acyl dehydratase